MAESGMESPRLHPSDVAVLLDVGGVLLLPDREVVIRALGLTGNQPNDGALERAHYQAISATDLAGTAGSGAAGTSYWREYARACGVADRLVSQTAGRLVTAFEQDFGWWRVIPGSREALAELTALAPVALVSNGDGRVEGALRELEICQVGPGPGVEVAAVIDSGVVGVGKPDPRIFNLALERLGIPPARAVHVGDTLRSDIDGARNAGIRPLHLTPMRCPDLIGDHDHVTHLRDVVATLRRRVDP